MKRLTASRRAFLKTSLLAAGATTFGRPLLLRAAPDSTAANSRIRLALVGCGGQGCSDLKGLLHHGAQLVALCDPDAAQIAQARADAKGQVGEAAKAYEDYRELLAAAASFDAVLIATPDHWHAPLCRAFMNAGKHVYCEKPLTRTLAEARELRELARRSKVITQMGNQGSASPSLRRCTEIIRAGALGSIREIHHWGVGVTAHEGSAEGEDPVPEGLNWDLWLGPAALRPYKKEVYHPFKWRNWFDLGSGGLGDIACHAMNLPVRALDLGYPERIGINRADGKQTPDKAAVEFHFPARGSLPPLVLHWQGGGKPPADFIRPLVETYAAKNAGPPDGLMIVGDRGCIYTSHWNTGGLIRLAGEERMTDVLRHEGTKDIPQSLPRSKGHGQEWLDACRGEGRVFSDFDVGGQLTEVALAGVVGLRVGRSIRWDGERMESPDAPEAARLVRTPYRPTWLT